MGFLFNLLPAAVVLGILIFIHELGHFIACKVSGVKVDKFSIGFGPEILVWQGKETRYALSLIPLGGFVKPSGESYDDLAGKQPAPHDFLAQSPAKRFFIAIAGILMNFFLAYLLFFVVFVVGRPVLLAQVGGFVEDYPAGQSGLKIGDRVTAFAGTPVETWKDLTEKIYESGAEEVRLTVSRETGPVEIPVKTKLEDVKDLFGKEHRIARIGIIPGDAYTEEKFPPLPALAKSIETVNHFTKLTFQSIYYLATGKLSMKMVSGPIGIFQIASKTAKLGIVHLLQLTAFLSISLAVFNVLPFPPLDGGLMLFILIEAVRKKEVSMKVQEMMTKTGFVLLLLLMVVVMFNDIANLHVVGKIKGMMQR